MPVDLLFLEPVRKNMELGFFVNAERAKQARLRRVRGVWGRSPQKPEPLGTVLGARTHLVIKEFILQLRICRYENFTFFVIEFTTFNILLLY